MTGVKEKGLRGTNQWLIEVERGCRKGWGGEEGVQKGLMKEGSEGVCLEGPSIRVWEDGAAGVEGCKGGHGRRNKGKTIHKGA